MSETTFPLVRDFRIPKHVHLTDRNRLFEIAHRFGDGPLYPRSLRLDGKSSVTLPTNAATSTRHTLPLPFHDLISTFTVCTYHTLHHHLTGSLTRSRGHRNGHSGVCKYHWDHELAGCRRWQQDSDIGISDTFIRCPRILSWIGPWDAQSDPHYATGIVRW